MAKEGQTEVVGVFDLFDKLDPKRNYSYSSSGGITVKHQQKIEERNESIYENQKHPELGIVRRPQRSVISIGFTSPIKTVKRWAA